VLGHLWNLGIKVQNLEREIAFLQACGATGLERWSTDPPNDGQRFATLQLGETRLVLLPEVIYEANLEEPLRMGLAHAVFEVDNTTEVINQLGRNGVKPLWGPGEISAGPFGRRRVVFFRSPSNLIIEAFQSI
jgi:catechol 2,3-dioxygenase-like lactoylglutathione lyase family enzyme